MSLKSLFLTPLVILLGSHLGMAQITFVKSSIQSGDYRSEAVAAGDFNGDGILDLVTTNSSTISFYKGLGGGRYAAPVNQAIPFPITDSYSKILVADFNRDGKLDIFLLPVGDYSGQPLVMLGNGDGTFTQGAWVPLFDYPYDAVIGDFNGDHIPDVAFATLGGSVCIDQGVGDGTFGQPTCLPATAGQLVSVVVGDFNGDGHQDLAAAGGNQVILYLGNGNGTFQPAVTASVAGAFSLAVGNFYNSATQTIAIYSTNEPSLGTYTSSIASARYAFGKLMVSKPQPFEGGLFRRIAAGDLNGDFKDDVVLELNGPNSSTELAYMLGNGNGTFQSPVIVGKPLNGDYPLIRDLDGDSRHDIAVAWSNTQYSSFSYTSADVGGVEILRNTGAAANCSAPPANRLAVHFCAPTNHERVGESLTFRVSANAFQGAPERIELWIDGKKAATALGDQLKTTLWLKPGTHLVTATVVDNFGNRASTSETIHAK